MLFIFLFDLNLDGVHCLSPPEWMTDCRLTLTVPWPLPKGGTKDPLTKGNDVLLRRLQHWRLTGSSEWGRNTQELNEVKFREKRILAGNLPRDCLERLIKKIKNSVIPRDILV